MFWGLVGGICRAHDIYVFTPQSSQTAFVLPPSRASVPFVSLSVVLSSFPAATSVFLSTCPKSLPGSTQSLTLLFSSLVSGNPPSVFRSHSVFTCGCSAPSLLSLARYWISMRNRPPVAGIRLTSPSVVEKVERSSWAYLSNIRRRLGIDHCAGTHVGRP